MFCVNLIFNNDLDRRRRTIAQITKPLPRRGELLCKLVLNFCLLIVLLGRGVILITTEQDKVVMLSKNIDD